MAKSNRVFAIFQTSEQAERAVSKLEEVGLRRGDISVLHPGNENSREFARRNETAPPVGTDHGSSAAAPAQGTLGFADPGDGPVAGVFEKTLRHMGVPREWSEGYVSESQILLAAQCNSPQEVTTAMEVLRTAGAQDAGSVSD